MKAENQLEITGPPSQRLAQQGSLVIVQCPCNSLTVTASL